MRTLAMVSALGWMALASLAVHGESVTIFPSFAQDMYIRTDFPGYNWAWGDNLQASKRAYTVSRSVIHLDLASYSGATVESDGAFYLFTEPPADRGLDQRSAEILVVPLLSEAGEWWGADFNVSTAPWNPSWTTFVQEKDVFDPTPITTFTTIDDPPQNTEYTFNIPRSVIQNWADDPASNHGIGLMLPDESPVSSDFIGGIFWSSDPQPGFEDYRPFLEFEVSGAGISEYDWASSSVTDQWSNVSAWNPTGTPSTSNAAANVINTRDFDQMVQITSDTQVDVVNISGATHQMTVEVAAESTLSATVNVMGNGVLAGRGTVLGTVNNTAGTVAPGNSVGRLTVGGYNQGAEGTLVIDLGGDSTGEVGEDFDQLRLRGAGRFDGNIEVNLANGYRPDHNEPVEERSPWVILTANWFDGEFNFDAEAARDKTGVEFSVDYIGTQRVDLTADVVYVPGDSDFDDDVDLFDFNRLALSFGGPGDWTMGDFSVDGVVSLTDFNFLALNFGHGAEAASVVPEPSGIIVFAVLGFAWQVTRGRVSRRERKRGVEGVKSHLPQVQAIRCCPFGTKNQPTWRFRPLIKPLSKTHLT